MTAVNQIAAVKLGDRAYQWWTEYCDPRKGDPAARARLRRCRSAIEALGVIAAVDLARRLGAMKDVATPDDRYLERALNLARVLAHVRESATESPMRQAGWKAFPGERTTKDVPASERPRLSEVRFRRLLETAGGEEMVSAFTRLIALLGATVNVATLSSDFLYWGDRTKRRWAFDYYAAGVAAPAAPNIQEEFDE